MKCKTRDRHARHFMIQWVVTVALLLNISAFCASPVLADSISFDLSVPNSALSGFTGPYAKVEVDLTGATTATITFTPYDGYAIGDGQSVDVNVNGAFTVGDPTITAPGSFKQFDNGSEADGFGKFNLVIDLNDGATHTTDLVRFDLTLTSGSWSYPSDVLVPNSDNYLAAAHIFVCDVPCQDGAATTGFAANDAPVPEPATLVLLSAGLAWAAGLGWRKM